jgi:prolipoprotein diacylglyceryl transferase
VIEALPATIPSPAQGVWYLGFFPVRAYAMCILAGIVAAVWIAQRRLEDRGGRPGQVLDIAAWAVPFGIVGGRLYHLITSPQPYFGAGGHPIDALKIWNGGLGIWGAVALGGVGAWIGCRRKGVSFLDFIDAAAPGVAVAQALGRWGNYFNNELYGGRTSAPWGLEIHQWDQAAGRAVVDAAGKPVVLGTFQPTFLFESLWCLLLALALVLLDRRVRLAKGQVFALYVMLYTLGRGVIEMLRTDQANHILGLRLNVWTSVIVFLGGLYFFWRTGRASREGQAAAGAQEAGHPWAPGADQSADRSDPSVDQPVSSHDTD